MSTNNTKVRPTSPTPSTMSARSNSSVRSTTTSIMTAGGTRKGEPPKKPSQFDGPEVTIDAVKNYIAQPHRGWNSALKEIARMEANAERVRRERDNMDTMSNASSVSAYSVNSVRSTMSMRSNTNTLSKPAGVYGVGQMTVQHRSASSHGNETGGHDNRSNVGSRLGTGGASSSTGVGGSSSEISMSGSRLAGSIAGLSGIRQRPPQPSSAPPAPSGPGTHGGGGNTASHTSRPPPQKMGGSLVKGTPSKMGAPQRAPPSKLGGSGTIKNATTTTAAIAGGGGLQLEVSGAKPGTFRFQPINNIPTNSLRPSMPARKAR